MFDFLKINRINKITADHAENISDYMILINIVNTSDAKKNLSKEQYQRYIQVFDEIAKNRKELSTNLLQFQHRAFQIAYKFEHDADVPYEQIYGDASDIYFMYSNMKHSFEDITDEIVRKYTLAIDTMIGNQALGEEEMFQLRSWSYAIDFFLYATSTIIGAFESLQTDYYIRFVYETAYKKLIELVFSKFNFTEGDYGEYLLGMFKSYREEIRKIQNDIYNQKDTLDEYIDAFTDAFMAQCNISDNFAIKHLITRVLDELKQIGNEDVK